VIREHLLAVMQQPSTWARIVALIATISGFNVSPDDQDAIVKVGVSVVGLLVVLWRERESKRVQRPPDEPQVPTWDKPPPARSVINGRSVGTDRIDP
jgi:hypothetical protein